MAIVLNSSIPVSSIPTLSMFTYNMHGFNQGNALLREMCSSGLYDIIFIQEHWLTPALMYKLINISDNYTCFGISAMETAVSTGILKGRPFGGCSILVRKLYSKAISNVACFERVVSLELGGIMFVNIYSPCEGSLDSLNILHELLANVSNIVEQSNVTNVVCDLNVDLGK